MLRLFSFAFFLSCIFNACTPAYKRFLNNYRFSNNGSPDYSSPDYWAAHPYKKDPSDSISSSLVSEYVYDSAVDVFFLHPTTFTNIRDSGWNADVNNAVMNARTDYSTILYQASVFNQARVFAPRYRQANLKAYYAKDTGSAKRAFDLAYEDLKRAFEYYLTHYNGNRPIVIAAHSQGSTHAIRLLKEFFDEKPLMKKLIVAYIPGMNIPFHSFNQLSVCTDSLQTGCFCGWRTFKRGYNPFLLAEYKDSYVVNPLSWKTNTDYASNSLNRGAVLRNFNKIYPQVTDAQIHEGFLWSVHPKFPGSFLYRAKNYHVGDINLFYLNIRENLQQRIAAFRRKELINGQSLLSGKAF